METLKAKRAWTDVLQVLKDHRRQFRLFYPEKLSVVIGGGRKTFNDETDLRNCNQDLHGILDGILQSEEVKRM